MNRSRLLLVSMMTLGLVVALVLVATRDVGSAETDDAPFAIVVERNVPAAMRDGVILRADIYRPDAPGRFPVVLRRTPYSKATPGAIDGIRELAALGYVVIVQDTRGRYTSDGVAVPHDEGDDGFDTVEWAAGLPYSNGRVAMYGGSYLATTQLTAAARRPPHLVAIAPSSSYANRYEMVYQGGAFYLSDGLGWNLGQAADVRRRRAGAGFEERDGPIGMSDEERTRFREDWVWHVPQSGVPAPDLRDLAPGYFWMLEHPTYDGFWETYDIRARHGEFETPALHVTGWYDTLLDGTIENFTGLRANAATERARDGQRLIIGPWTHSGPTLKSTRIGDVDFGPDAGLDYRAELIDWLDRWLREGGSEDGEAARQGSAAPIRLFVMGENRWRDEREWPLSRARPTPWYLGSDGNANTLSGDGRLSPTPPATDPPDRYVFDPHDPMPTAAAGGYSRSPADPSAWQTRPDVLVYTSAPLDEDLEVTGPIELVLWIESSAPDTDFTGKLIDVSPDGTARTLTDGILRVRYRGGFETARLLTPGAPAEIRIDLLATSNLFRAGHRIRLVVSSSDFPRFDRNPNTGTAVADEPTLVPARQTVFHDPERPSRIILPVVPRPGGDAGG
ncbi:MAG: CocE/NonD family hydrolase [Gemmatimonadota bacterium]|nr:CocE/NonD family hydrolase [Gemmatimonadota bacterium]